ncbi:VWA domain-containing protein [Halosquirtibacter laminarini]|uniref:VWA domain-containing protein n=1 Tax=Halosquirtibacter laminarini TaxID=3374600 RepID=A0AC61NJ12_9BACT|nr:VWA domain-containing protein [Prolixibacteraceae bacterium]
MHHKPLKWVEDIPVSLRSYVITNYKTPKRWLPWMSAFLGLAFLIIAMATPAIKGKPLPTKRIKTTTWLVLDLSSSMNQKDIRPSRLERAKMKLEEFINKNNYTDMGLIVFAGSSHVLLPPTGAKATLKSYIREIDSSIMPVSGKDITALRTLCDSLMQSDTKSSSLILITDRVLTSSLESLRKDASMYQMNIFPWYIVSKQQALAYSNSSDTFLTVDESDVNTMILSVKKSKEVQVENDSQNIRWIDSSFYMILIAILFFLPVFRKGWIIRSWLLFLLCTSISSCDLTQDRRGIWTTADYRAQLMSKKGNWKEAEKNYQSVSHKAYAAYKVGDFDEAANLYALDSTKDSRLNATRIYIVLKEYDLAQQSLDRVLDRFPRDKEGLALNDTIASLKEKVSWIQKKKKKSDWKEQKGKKKKYGEKQFVDRVFDPEAKLDSNARVEGGKVQKAFQQDRKLNGVFGSDPNGAVKVLIRSSKSDPKVFLKKKLEMQEQITNNVLVKKKML